MNPYIGYENSTRIAQKALEANRSVAELVLEEKLLSREQLEDVLETGEDDEPAGVETDAGFRCDMPVCRSSPMRIDALT
ncbi:MAG: hypothetical protein MZU95_10875 [Desulfomicrobium escambiense]|nr:hypothetical protein [Desulfomicrobium escambiense]